MNKRERVRCAIAHREPDRVPKGELCIEADLANRLLHKTYPDDYQHFERDLAVRQLLNIDLVNIGDWPAEYIGMDENGRRRYRSVYGYEYVTTGMSKHVVLPPVTDISDAGSYQTPDIRMVSGALIRQFKESTDLFVFGQIGGPVSLVNEMFGMEDYMVYSMTDTPQILKISERVMEHEIQKAKLFIDSGAEAIILTDDIAFNSGLLLPPQIMEQVAFPFYSLAVREIKKHADVPVFFHSDGNLNAALDRIAACGFNGIQSLQPSAGMDIAAVKRAYGKDLCLMGNIDLDYVMTRACPEEVKETVRRTIDAAAEGGGYILSTCNTLINAIPEANALAMYAAADEYGVYKKQ